MKAIIMAGGEGNRLRPLTSNRPKPMIPVINKPVIEHAINLLRANSITDITISLFYLPDSVQNYFGDGSDWDVNISYSVEEIPLGTAGGVKKAFGGVDEPVIILSGDGIVDFDIQKVLRFHTEKESKFTIVLTRVKSPIEYGIAVLDENSRIDKFLEKPAWGEVFSDTVNTGMYVVEPEIIRRYIPEDAQFDFSLDLIPLLKSEGIPMYGHIAEGYWCDVGTMHAYREVHQAILDGKVRVDFPGKKIGDAVWVGRNVEIAANAKIRGPVVLGNFVKVKNNAEVSEFSVIGDNCVIEENASVRRSIILHNTVIGPKSELRGAIIGKRCYIEDGVSIYEGAVVSDDCEIGSGAEIPPGIRVWPEKIIESGARLASDLIWGQTEKKVLFSADGIVGSFNVKITPEFAAKLGSAIGAYLGKNSTVIISRDVASSSRLIKRALTAGLLSMGVVVYDMEIESIPINRYSTRFTGADMGIYVQMSPTTGLQFIQIKIFNKFGFQISVAEEKKIENIFFRGDYPRTDAFEVGKLVYPIHHNESYISSAKSHVDSEILRRRKWSIILDCFNGTTSYVFPDVLASFGCSTTVLRGQIKEYMSEEELKIETQKAIDNVITMSKANGDIGVIIDPHGENLTIIDERGNLLLADDIGALLCVHYMKYKNERILNIPVTSSMAIEKIAALYGGDVRRVSTKLRSPQGAGDIFAASPSGIHPYLALEYDPMIAFLLVLEFATLENAPIHTLRKAIPRGNLKRISIQCTMDEKAGIMRMFSNIAPSAFTRIELVDGVRMLRDNAWILLLPDAAQPQLHLYAEGDTVAIRDALIEECTRMIRKQKQG